MHSFRLVAGLRQVAGDYASPGRVLRALILAEHILGYLDRLVVQYCRAEDVPGLFHGLLDSLSLNLLAQVGGDLLHALVRVDRIDEVPLRLWRAANIVEASLGRVEVLTIIQSVGQMAAAIASYLLLVDQTQLYQLHFLVEIFLT